MSLALPAHRNVARFAIARPSSLIQGATCARADVCHSRSGSCGAAANAAAQTTGPCLKPWAIPDRWVDNHDDSADGGIWTEDDTFETVDSDGDPLSDADVYGGLSDQYYTGFTRLADLGRKITLKIGDPNDRMKAGWIYAIDLGPTGGGAYDYRTAIATCQDTGVRVMELLRPLSGNRAGATVQGVADLINLDPTAKWEPGSGVVDSCASSEACGSVSPRVVIFPVFDPAYFEAGVNYSGQLDLKVTNFLYVFIDGVVGGNITAYITTSTGVNHP